MSKKLKEYERHIIRTAGKAWCERAVSTFDLPFQGIDHALLAMETGRLLPCIECMEAAASELQEKLLIRHSQ
jgi:hypothetical protein